MAKHKLRFREDGTFKIVQFTDVHWTTGGEEDSMSRQVMENVLDSESPDLVVFSGDLISGNKLKDIGGNARQAMRQVTEVAERKQVPWAAVFGNHDDEGDANRRELLEVLQEGSYALTEAGPKELSGVGNYILSVQSSVQEKVSAALYMIDSNSYGKPGKWGWIKRDQIAWYVNESTRLTKENGGPLPALAFIHIPLPEYNDVWDFTVCYGEKGEGVCSPQINTGMFAAMVEMGDVSGVFAGHDHVNDYWGELHGIRLCYGRATGGYGGDKLEKGARIIRLYENQRDFETWIRLGSGTAMIQQREHQPTGRTAP